MAVKTNLTLNAPITAEDNVEPQKASDVIDQVLQRAVILVSWSPKALFDVIAELGHVRHVLRQEPTESFAGSVGPRGIIERSN
jgi:hypothetical protein